MQEQRSLGISVTYMRKVGMSGTTWFVQKLSERTKNKCDIYMYIGGDDWNNMISAGTNDRGWLT